MYIIYRILYSNAIHLTVFFIKNTATTGRLKKTKMQASSLGKGKKNRAHFLSLRKEKKKTCTASPSASWHLLCFLLPCYLAHSSKRSPLPAPIHPTAGTHQASSDGVRLRPRRHGHRAPRRHRRPPPHARARQRVRQSLAPAADRRRRGLPRRRGPLPDSGGALDEPNPRSLQPDGMYCKSTCSLRIFVDLRIEGRSPNL